MTSPEQGKVIPLWHFMYASRGHLEEQAYREYYLDADIQQFSIIITSFALFLTCLTAVDVSNLDTEPHLLVGVIGRSLIAITYLLLLWALKSQRRPLILDCCSFLVCIPMILMVISYAHQASTVRIICTVFVGLYVSVTILPTYVSSVAIPIAILVGGEGVELLTADRVEMANNVGILVVSVLFSTIISCMSSALRHRSRYLYFQAMSEVKQLSGLLPMCSGCKKIRDDDGYYQQIEEYIGGHSEAEFSRASCPDCATALFPGLTLSGE